MSCVQALFSATTKDERHLSLGPSLPGLTLSLWQDTNHRHWRTNIHLSNSTPVWQTPGNDPHCGPWQNTLGDSRAIQAPGNAVWGMCWNYSWLQTGELVSLEFLTKTCQLFCFWWFGGWPGPTLPGFMWGGFRPWGHTFQYFESACGRPY